MQKYIVFLILLFSTIAANGQPYQWFFKTNTTDSTVKTGTKYTLYNTSSEKSLIYKEHKKGINLGWKGGKNKPFNIVLTHQTGKDTLAACSEVAILVLGGAYLTYTEREYGITLGWSSVPVYEWLVTRDDKTCGALKTDKKYGLFNLKARKYLVYQARYEPIAELDWLEE